MKRAVKKARSAFVCYIIPKPAQVEEERKKSNNQIPSVSKKRIFEEYKDLERVFQVELIVIIFLDKRRIYNINLEKGKIFLFYFIYLLIVKELMVL